MNNISKEYLIEQYMLGKEVREIAKENDCGATSISRLNKRYEIDVYKYNPKYLYRNEEWLKKQFELYTTLEEVTRKTGYPKTCIARYAEKYGIREKAFSRNSKNNVDENYFDYIDNSNKAYFLGFIMADGCIYYHTKLEKYEFSLQIKDTDSDLIFKFAKDIDFPLDKIFYRSRTRKGTVCNSVNIRIYNTRFCENLIKHGIIPRKGGHEAIPNSVPKEFIYDFIRGYIDGDGWVLVNCRPCIDVCSTSIKIMNDILCYLREITEINSNISLNNNVYTLNISKRVALYRILKKIYYEECVSLDRKKKNSEKIINDYIKDFL